MSDNSSPRQSTQGNSSPTFRQLAPNMETLGGALGYQFSYCQVSPSPIKSTYLLTYLLCYVAGLQNGHVYVFTRTLQSIATSGSLGLVMYFKKQTFFFFHEIITL